MTDLSELIARLERAAGPDRGLDAAIWYALIEQPRPGDKRDQDMIKRWPAYTSSLDAALALVALVRPGWKWERQWEPGGEFIRLLAPDYYRWTFKGALNRAATGWQSCVDGDAIAVVRALLRTYEANHD